MLVFSGGSYLPRQRFCLLTSKVIGDGNTATSTMNLLLKDGMFILNPFASAQPFRDSYDIYLYIYIYIYISYTVYWYVLILILSVVRYLHQNMMVLVVIDGDWSKSYCHSGATHPILVQNHCFSIQTTK